ncbi:MAG: hypothetical protein HRU72_02300 [Planctomycetia bacterium]|nr:hypothetical protein [Candidatus Brocadia sp.]QOJ05465.1 MAG: hypothetical protein HRU72_02300 [Planctomycetia bacterium]TVL96904.1 MAG: hypothetical protein CV082_05645 [Candidatus Brocadia sp. BL1]HQU32241.1 DNA methyltransferase [Candidatus Brocadia sapporoensis]
MSNRFYQIPKISNTLFGGDVKLLSSVDELFELELANLEYHILNKDELIERSAFFQLVNGKPTKHFQLYSAQSLALTEDRSAQTKNYFENGQFSTGYATHGLFPYRGKFHPQLIKGLLNIIGIKKTDVILDPMCGSGTANIEAALMGINSYAVDQSPFCQFMVKTKFEALAMDVDLLKGLSLQAKNLYNFFDVKDVSVQLEKIKSPEKLKVYHLALLAFLDAMGYSLRVTKSNHKQLFKKVLERYQNTVHDFLNNPYYKKDTLGFVRILSNSNALKLELNSESVDGVITSPPYSFAIDYVKNDEAQLKYLGYDAETIKSNMIGLVGKNKTDRLNNYFRDMETVCSEVSRVLKRGKFFIMIIGSNTNQTGGIRLENRIIDSCHKFGLNLVKSILKPIKGMRNTMKDEYILFFEKTA